MYLFINPCITVARLGINIERILFINLFSARNLSVITASNKYHLLADNDYILLVHVKLVVCWKEMGLRDAVCLSGKLNIS